MCILFVIVFESLQKAFAKAKSVVEKEGATPKFYIRSLVELEDFVKEVTYTCIYMHVRMIVRYVYVTTPYHPYYVCTVMGRQRCQG